jgi:hypothetical protein
MSKIGTPKERLLLVVGAVGLLVAVSLFVLLVYALTHAGMVTLRWWAGVVTMALPLAALFAYYLGRLEARAVLAGLNQGVGAVMDAAQQTANLRSSASASRGAKTPPVQIVNLPGLPSGFSGAPAIMASRRDTEDVTL